MYKLPHTGDNFIKYTRGTGFLCQMSEVTMLRTFELQCYCEKSMINFHKKPRNVTLPNDDVITLPHTCKHYNYAK